MQACECTDVCVCVCVGVCTTYKVNLFFVASILLESAFLSVIESVVSVWAAVLLLTQREVKYRYLPY